MKTRKIGLYHVFARDSELHLHGVRANGTLSKCIIDAHVTTDLADAKRVGAIAKNKHYGIRIEIAVSYKIIERTETNR